MDVEQAKKLRMELAVASKGLTGALTAGVLADEPDRARLASEQVAEMLRDTAAALKPEYESSQRQFPSTGPIPAGQGPLAPDLNAAIGIASARQRKILDNMTALSSRSRGSEFLSAVVGRRISQREMLSYVSTEIQSESESGTFAGTQIPDRSVVAAVERARARMDSFYRDARTPQEKQLARLEARQGARFVAAAAEERAAERQDWTLR
jgi:hypothetical protein